jgi:hypothetical protein
MTARLGCDVCGTETENLPYPSRNYRGLCDECRNLDWKVERVDRAGFGKGVDDEREGY